MSALHGLTVLVTRPARQAEPLCRLLESEGAAVIRLPVLEIRVVGDVRDWRSRLGPVATFDLVVFTSVNAVHFGAPLLDEVRAPALAAIGPATARALAALGHTTVITPRAGFDSEHLLEHPALDPAQGRRVLIVKGQRGRELLQERLTQRGAQVVVAEVYARCPAAHDADRLSALDARFAAGGLDVVTATSVDVAAALLDLAPPGLRRGLSHAWWLVPGARVAAALRERGVDAPLIHADSAEDQDLLAAVKRWRSSASGA